MNIMQMMMGCCNKSSAGGLDENTVLLMHMNGEDDGTTFSDSSTENNKGNAAVTADVNTKTGTIKWGTASALFDGDSGYLSYADSADWDICGSNTDSWSIDFWVKFTDHSSSEVLISQREDASNMWYLIHTDGSGWRFEARLLGATKYVQTGYGGEITDTDWHHIALCKVAAAYGVYVDGSQVNYHSQSETDTFAGSLVIGALGGGSFFDGYIDELRIQHSNVFGAAPSAGIDDTITVPTGAYS